MVGERGQINVETDYHACCVLCQVRKLEFLLAEALEQNCDSVVACGAAQSNCARACAIAARQLGLHPHLVLGMEGGTVSRSIH